jgi:hypothetical protein
MLEKTHNGGSVVVMLPCVSGKLSSHGKAFHVYHKSGVYATLHGVIFDGLYDERVDCYIVSAKYGVMPLDKEIESYDKELKEDDVGWLTNEIGEFLEEHDYDLLYSFLSGLYERAISEVGYGRSTNWDIDTLMFSPCCRTPMLDGRDMLEDIVSREVDIESAAEVDW